MMRSGDRIIGSSGDRDQNLTTDTWRQGESSDRNQSFTMNTQGHEESGATTQDFNDEARRRGESGGSRVPDHPITRDHPISRSPKAFSREFPEAPFMAGTASGSFDSPSSRGAGLRLAQDDSERWNRLQKNLLPIPSTAQRVARRALDIWQLLLATLREIFDENAYERFLRRTQASRSVESYRAFLREREGGIARKPRCC